MIFRTTPEIYKIYLFTETSINSLLKTTYFISYLQEYQYATLWIFFFTIALNVSINKTK